jgi:hypothetical protein
MSASTLALPQPTPAQLARGIAGAVPADLSKSPLLGILGVIMGAGIVTLTGRMLTLGLVDLRGGLGFGFDDGAWISSAYNIALMFIGPFTVYVGALLGARRVLFFAASSFTVICLLAPFSHSLQPDDLCHGFGWAYLRHVLSSDADLRTAQYPTSIPSVYRRTVCDLCRRSRQYCAIAIRLVPGAPFMALDILELRGNYGVHDALLLLRNAQAGGGKEIRLTSKLCRFSVLERGTSVALRSHRSRRAA